MFLHQEFIGFVGDIDVGDGCGKQNVLATNLRSWRPIQEFNITMSPTWISPIYLVDVFASGLIFAYGIVKSYHWLGDSNIGDLYRWWFLFDVGDTVDD